MSNQETYLRKQYLKLVETFKYQLSKHSIETDKIYNKYLPQIRKNKYWIKFHLSSIIIPLIIGGFLSFVAKDGGILKKYIFIPLYIGIFITLIILVKLIKQLKLKKEIATLFKEETDRIKEDFLDPGEKNLKKAAYLVVDLMIEEELGDRVLEIKRKSTPKVFNSFYDKLRVKYAQRIKAGCIKKNKNNKVNFHDIISYYERWYQNKHFKSRSGEERLKINLAKANQLRDDQRD